MSKKRRNRKNSAAKLANGSQLKTFVLSNVKSHAIDAGINLVSRRIQNGSLTKNDLKEVGKNTIQSLAIKGIKHGTEIALKKGAPKVVSKLASKTASKATTKFLSKAGGPIAGGLVDSTLILFDSSKSGGEKAARVTKTALVVGLTVAFPAAGVAIWVGDTILDFFW